MKVGQAMKPEFSEKNRGLGLGEKSNAYMGGGLGLGGKGREGGFWNWKNRQGPSLRKREILNPAYRLARAFNFYPYFQSFTVGIKGHDLPPAIIGYHDSPHRSSL